MDVHERFKDYDESHCWQYEMRVRNMRVRGRGGNRLRRELHRLLRGGLPRVLRADGGGRCV